MENFENTINIGKIIQEKTGKKLPRFIVRWIEHFIHQDFINTFLKQGYSGIEFFTKSTEYMGHKLTVSGLDNINLPNNAKVTFAANHPLGGADGLAIMGIIGTARKYHPIKLLVNDFLMYFKAIAPMCVPINKIGNQSKSLPTMVNELFASDCDIVIFPAGKCSRLYNNTVQDPEWKKTVITKSVENNRWIVPIHFIGENSHFFYLTDKLFRLLRIKFNIGMLLLPNEFYHSQGKHYKIIFGKPIPPSQFDNSHTPYEWAQILKNEVYKL